MRFDGFWVKFTSLKMSKLIPGADFDGRGWPVLCDESEHTKFPFRIPDDDVGEPHDALKICAQQQQRCVQQPRHARRGEVKDAWRSGEKDLVFLATYVPL